MRYLLAFVALVMTMELSAQSRPVPLTIVRASRSIDTAMARQNLGRLSVITHPVEDPSLVLRAAIALRPADSVKTAQHQFVSFDSTEVARQPAQRAGRYELSVAQIGYVPIALDITVMPGCHTVAEIFLSAAVTHGSEGTSTPARATVTTCPGAS